MICCVPGCDIDSWKCNGFVTFYDFPSNPELRSRWIKQINIALNWKTAWSPHGRPVLCSKHFLHTDFKEDSDILKPCVVPTVFGHKYIGLNPQSNESVQEINTSPLIVKVLRPTPSVSENDDNSDISNVSSHANFTNRNESKTKSDRQVVKVNETNLQTSPSENSILLKELNKSSYIHKKNLPTASKTVNHAKNNPPSNIPSASESLPHNATKASCDDTLTLDSNAATANNTTANNFRSLNNKPNLMSPKNAKKKESSTDLIEIGPNTFLKINPEIIKVNKKQTPSGNTVLQFVMDQKVAKNYSGDILPKLIQDVSSSSLQKDNSTETAKTTESSNKDKDENIDSNNQKEKVQHVLGHVVDNHVCEDSCIDLTLDENEDELMDISENTGTNKNLSENEDNQKSSGNDASEQVKNAPSTSVLDRAPVLLTTNMPLNHCFIDRPKYILQLKQKNRQIASLKFKLTNLNKKIEELEDRCIVQERQLSYSFVKRLKTIQKNAAKGDPCATYILEQIRSYSYDNNSKMRWSDSTLTQCAIWCRKAPYAYEYFKKAGFFKLPCLGTVKRFMKKHPEIKLQKSVVKSVQSAQGEESESSSDFEFDESDNQNNNEMSEDENDESTTCENILSEMAETVASNNIDEKSKKKENNEIQMATESITIPPSETNIQDPVVERNDVGKASITSEHNKTNDIPITVDTSNLELQEIVLPSGEVVQCYSSNVISGSESGQYFIIPNVSDQGSVGDHEYSVIQADSMPVILQNIENSQLSVRQDQLIFIAKSSEHTECGETEVSSA